MESLAVDMLLMGIAACSQKCKRALQRETGRFVSCLRDAENAGNEKFVTGKEHFITKVKIF